MPVFQDLPERDKEEVVAFFEVVKKAFADTISKASFEDTEVSEADYGPADVDTMSKALGGKAILLDGSFTGALNSPFAVIINEAGLLGTVGKMLMMSPEDIEARIIQGFTDEDRDASREIGVQILSNVGSFLGKHYEDEISGRLGNVLMDALGSEGSKFFGEDVISATCSFGEGNVVAFLMNEGLLEDVRFKSVAADEPGQASAGPASAESTLERVLKLDLPISVVLSEKMATLKMVTSWTAGTILEFEKNHEELLNLVVSDKAIAEGEAVKVGENFGLRIRKIGTPRDTIEKLR